MKRKREHVAKSYYVNPNKRFNYERATAIGAGAALGVITAGGTVAAGAAYGIADAAVYGGLFAAGAYDLTHPNKMQVDGGAGADIPFAPGTSLAGRRVHGKKAVKFSSNGTRVHVAKRLRQKIEKVIEDKKVSGSVKQVYMGFIGAIDDLTSGSYSMGGLNSTNATKYAADTQYIWQGMLNVNNANAKLFELGVDFRLFSPYRILDAASILWNRKVPNINYNTQTNNFTTAVNAAGVSVNLGTDAYVGSSGPQIMLKSAKATFFLKNNSMRTHYLRMYVCKPKRKWVGLSPLDTWDQAMLADNAEGTTNLLDNADTIFYGNTFTANGIQPTDAHTMIGCTPNISKKFKEVWQYEHIDMTLEPGQSIAQVVHGPRNQMYDWSKMWDGSVLNDTKPQPKFDRWVMFVGNLDIVNDTLSYPTRGYGTAAADGEVRPINVEMTLDYVLEMPEITGFPQNTRAATAGQSQQLVYRRPRKALLNFINSTVRAHSALTRIDDQNPCVACANT